MKADKNVCALFIMKAIKKFIMKVDKNVCALF